jgi:hypothetical protein
MAIHIPELEGQAVERHYGGFFSTDWSSLSDDR